MKVAMRLHNTAIRMAYSRYQGYEVKTIGDAFMITFDQANDALRFCIDAQIELLNCDWPEEILIDSLCAPITKAGQLIYRGMRVRMGVHTGDVATEMDPVSNRADYFGHTVNTAARIESAGTGGCIICSEAVVQNINPSLLKCTIVPLGSPELKGVGQCKLYGVVPTEISERGAHLATKKTPLEYSLRLNTTPQSANAVANKGKYFKMLIKDLCNDRLLSDQLVKSALNKFLSSDDLQPLAATVIHIRAAQNLQKMPALLHLVGTLAKRTFGVMLNTVTTTITVVWICQAHTVQAVSFAASLFGESMHDEFRLYLGMASGGVMFGITNPGEDKHVVTCVGGPVDLSFAMAEAAELLDITCLVPGTIVAGAPSLTRLLRPVDRWPFHGVIQTYVEVNELHLPGLAGAEKWDILYGMYEDTSWCDEAYRSAFDDVKNGDFDQMNEIAKRWPNDILVKRILQAEGGQLCRTAFLPGLHIKTKDAIGAKENLEEAWKRTTAASRSARAELVYMEGWAYDISTFMHSHPGGRELFKAYLGKDITDAFRGNDEEAGKVHDHSMYAGDILRTLRVFKTDNLATNESNMMIVRDTWKQLRSVGLKEIGVLLFRNMFEKHPEYLQYFPWGNERHVYESKGMADHGLQVMTAVDKAVTDLAKSHEVAHILHELGKTHLRFGIKKPMFDVMAQAFDITFRSALQELYTPQVRYAWNQTIKHIILMAKDGIADMREDHNAAIVSGEYRSLQYVRREARTHNTTLFVFHLHGISEQFFAPGSHVSLRFNGKLSRPYSILKVLNDELHLLIKLNQGRQSSKELQGLTSDSLVEVRGPVLAEHQYVKGQDMLLIGGGTGCVPLLSMAAAALKDEGRVWMVVCADTYGDVAFKHELEELHGHSGEFHLMFLFTKGRSIPEGIHAMCSPVLHKDHIEAFFPTADMSNHVIICGPPAFNTQIRASVLALSYTFTVMGSLLTEPGVSLGSFNSPSPAAARPIKPNHIIPPDLTAASPVPFTAVLETPPINNLQLPGATGRRASADIRSP
eukprot:TRINITY_DN3140_c0_g4_i1.p1 TRINITY_DN3140_c0_g4~~TRINITY_DN3140_c0_g4_i1.p1  ORF type:complete len:1154 (+),score=377.18 TRINITY_DN3140_c0_g4_i1:373-3462(+)